MTDNPYASPQQKAAEPPQGNPLLPPAIILLVLAGLTLAMLLLYAPIAIEQMQMQRDFSTAESTGRTVGYMIGSGGFLIVSIVVQLVVIVGSVSMIRCNSYWLSMAAAIVSVIPFCSSCYLLGIPFGIWALVLLNRRDMKQRFRSK